MKKENKIKIFLGLIYILVIVGFLWVFFSKFTVGEITSYEFIKNNKHFFIELKKKFFYFKYFFFYLLFFGFCY